MSSNVRTPLRVMMIGSYPHSPNRINGGVEAATTYLSEAMAAEAGVDLIGVRISKDGLGPKNGSAFAWPIVDISLGKLSLSTFYRRQKARLKALIGEFQPDIVHGQGVDLAGHLAVTCGLPSVVTVHGLLRECAKYQTNRITKARATLGALLTERRTVRRATDLIAISPYVRAYYGRTITAQVHEIPNPVAPRYFRVRRAAERGRLLFAGRIANGKGIVEFLRSVALERTRVSRVVLAGATTDPAYERALRREIEGLGLPNLVTFAGLLDEQALAREFELAEVLILPSFQETAPMVIQQAMAAGLAVIATRVGGVIFQIEHERTGLLFEPGDVSGLASLLARLSADQGLSRRLGDAARDIATERYQARTVALSTISVYESILNRRANASATTN